MQIVANENQIILAPENYFRPNECWFYFDMEFNIDNGPTLTQLSFKRLYKMYLAPNENNKTFRKQVKNLASK